ncbi:MAG: aminoglycoside 6-adenylyltransferase [Clostridiales bacterium]|nr:aminoglycoside 6-adenylyltransferase [Clostridiales bacterium]
MSDFTGIIKNFTAWGSSCKNLRAAIIIGSQARTDDPADAYSDLDLLLLADDPEYFLASDKWLEQIGHYHISFTEDTLGGAKEKRVLFDGALDVDFNILTKDAMHAAIQNGQAAGILGRGYRVLLDKDGFAASLPPVTGASRAFAMPSEKEFLNTANDFWYHMVWAAKKLKRGELWTAKACLDCHANWRLLSMIEWYSRAVHGISYDTWHNGRYLEKWAEGWIIEKLARIFSRYDKEDIISSLVAAMELFRRIAIDVAEKLGFEYPESADKFVSDWINKELRL